MIILEKFMIYTVLLLTNFVVEVYAFFCKIFNPQLLDPGDLSTHRANCQKKGTYLYGLVLVFYIIILSFF